MTDTTINDFPNSPDLFARTPVNGSTAIETEHRALFPNSPELFVPKAPEMPPPDDTELRKAFSNRMSSSLFPNKPTTTAAPRPVPTRPATAPADLELKLPEGLDANDPTIAAFKRLAAESGLDSAKAQRLFDAHREALASQERAALGEIDGWFTASQNDEEIGGQKFEATTTAAVALVNEFGTPALKEFLSGAVGEHPEVRRLLSRVSTALRTAREGR